VTSDTQLVYTSAGAENDGPNCRAWKRRTWNCRTWHCKTWQEL